MCRQLGIHRFAFSIVSAEKAMGRKHIRRTQIHTDTVYRSGIQSIGKNRPPPYKGYTSCHHPSQTKYSENDIPYFIRELLHNIKYNLQGQVFRIPH